MDVSLAEFARRRGISQRRAQQLAQSGRIRARRVDRFWLVDVAEVGSRRISSRPLSPEASWALIGALSGHPIELSHPQERARLRDRLRRLVASNDRAALLHGWLRDRSVDVLRLHVNPRDLDDLRDDVRLVPSGISDARAGLSSANELEAYVAKGDADGIVDEYLLLPSADANVRLRVVDRALERPVPLGLVLADLADWNLPREDARLSELIDETPWIR